MDNSTRTIIQWNCRGFKPNYDELSLLINDHNPIAVCLQETYLKASDKISIKNYSLYNSYSTNPERATGGVSVIVNNDTPHRAIPLNTPIAAIAVSVSGHKTITLCSIYLPPSGRIDPEELDDLLNQLPSPYILMGDFNGHSLSWGTKPTNNRGRQIEDFIARHNLCMFNDKSHTYLHPATGSYTSLDLTLCHPSLLLDFSWKVGEDDCGSDHFPIFLSHNGPPEKQRVRRWKLHKAD